MTTSSDILESIRSRGHWHVTIRPVEFVADRIEWADLESMIDHVRVSRRGWSVPHNNTRERLDQDDDWIGQSTSWDYHREVWRFYTSGQFVHINALTTDWFDQSRLRTPDEDWQAGRLLGVAETLFTLREYFELAARLALAVPGADEMSVSIAFNGLAGRQLYADDPNRGGLFETYESNTDRFSSERTMSRAALSGSAFDLSVETGLRLFERKFGWKADTKQLAQYLETMWDRM